jgi:hypothetical protein
MSRSSLLLLGASAITTAGLCWCPEARADAEPPARKKSADEAERAVTFPPALPGGVSWVSDTSDRFLKPSAPLREGVAVATAVPTVDFLYFPGQNSPGHPWSAWGDSVAVAGKYYASIGDHLAPEGNAFVYEYDPGTRQMRRLVDVRAVLGLPAGHYTPGKIHSRLEMGDDGWLYFSSHRGATTVTTDQYHYRGDWILRHHPASGRSEVVVAAPVPKHCIPAGVLDPKRLIFYGGTAPGTGDPAADIQFFAYDVKAAKRLYAGPNGPARALIIARSTGKVYFTAGTGKGPLWCFDPAQSTPGVAAVSHGRPPDDTHLNVRAATEETPEGFVYAVSQGLQGEEAQLYGFNTRSERISCLGPAAVASQQYIAGIDADPSGHYLYYIPGAHGGSDHDGSPIVQYDVKTARKKVIAFLHPYYQDRYHATLRGTYSMAVAPDGATLYITWNVSRGSRSWDCCALAVVHIPEAERRP